jgi:F0F1-type ATP synthase assembly protein I
LEARAVLSAECYAVAMADDNRDSNQSASVLWARYSQLAFILPAAVVVGLLIGKLLDYWLHTKWLFLAGIILGAVVGFVDMIRMITKQKM